MRLKLTMKIKRRLLAYCKDNILYVYKSDKETEIAETDINISNMSLKDRKIIINGIYVESSEELFKFLEANTS